MGVAVSRATLVLQFGQIVVPVAGMILTQIIEVVPSIDARIMTVVKVNFQRVASMKIVGAWLKARLKSPKKSGA